MNYLKRNLNKRILILIFVIYTFTGISVYIKAEDIYFTQEELDYISRASVLKAVSINGIAPLSYTDSKGEIKGIGIRVLDKISEMTGLAFEYKLYETVGDSLKSDFDIYVNAAQTYASDDMVLSQPYLEAETILYINSSVDPTHLDNKIFAAVKGGNLPEGIKEENTIYLNDREEAINAVENGKADYGFGNEYSLAFYILQKAATFKWGYGHI